MAGGVGKTPIVRELGRNLKNPVVVMRGYGGTKSGLVTGADSVKRVGDEAKMLSADIPVITGARRTDGVKLAETMGFDAIIMDDGFQNPTFGKEVSVLVFDEKIGVPNRFLLPAGPFREPLYAGIRRCDAILIMDDNRPIFPVLAAAKRFKKPVFYVKTQNSNPGLRGKIIAFAGIGYPMKFFTALRKMLAPVDGENMETFSFADHHPYTDAELDKLTARAAATNATLVTTEKDWVRLPEKYLDKVRYVPLTAKIDDAFWTWLTTYKRNGGRHAHL